MVIRKGRKKETNKTKTVIQDAKEKKRQTVETQ
jgi:hypothetical protein